MAGKGRLNQLLTRHVLTVALSLFFILHSIGLFQLSFIQQLERYAYDLRLNATKSNQLDQRVVIIDIDEKSLAEIGRWPWSRDRMADMVDILFEHYQINVLGFDIVFAEPDESSGLGVLQSFARQLPDDHAFQKLYRQRKTELNYDQRFAESLKGRNVVLGYFLKGGLFQGEKNSGALPPPLSSLTPELQSLPLLHAGGYGGNLPQLQANAVGGGFIDIPAMDSDGVIRKVVMLQVYDGQVYESLSLAMLRNLFSPPAKINYQIEQGLMGGEYRNLEGIRIGEGLYLPVDENGAALVPYRGPSPSFTYVSAIDVLNKTISTNVMNNAVVLVGTTAAGLLDLRATPVQAIYPGVEIHANLISGVLDQNLKHSPAYVVGMDVVLMLLLIGVMGWLLPRLHFSGVVLLTVLAVVFIIASNMALWIFAGHVLPIINQLLLVLGLFILHVSYGYMVEDREKRQLRIMFGQYVPPELIEEMQESGERVELQGEMREMSVLFSDIRSFTTLAESMAPRQVTQLMNQYLTAMTREIQNQRGTIDKYIGDAIMSFWGAPVKDEHHAEHAVLAAMAMLEALPKINRDFVANNWPQLEIGIGINTGNMHVGNMGSEFRMSYTVLGDAVNTASRFESLTKFYKVPLIVGARTVKQADNIQFMELDRIRISGMEKNISIFAPVAHKAELDFRTRSIIDRYHQGVSYYRKQDWNQAQQIFAELEREQPENPIHSMYLTRISLYQHQPPGEEWDGIWTHTIKKDILD